MIGSACAITWDWCGEIPEVDIEVSIDGGLNYDHFIAENLSNAGIYNIVSEDWNGDPGDPCKLAWIREPGLWTTETTIKYKGVPTMEARLRITASDGSLSDESDNDFYIPVNLGILYTMSQQSSEGDSDMDGIADNVEEFLGTNPYEKDSDKDWLTDYDEIFGTGFFCSSFDPDDPVPNFDQDNTISAIDTDDNNDGIHDGDSIDTDGDNIPNYLEYYGFTWDWIQGKFNLWDEETFDKPYFKTDPMQYSTDQDPYSDYMETTKANMDPSVKSPGDSPMVPATPEIEIVLDHYLVTLKPI